MDWFHAEAWDGQRLRLTAPAAAAQMIARLDDPDPALRAELVLLLGLLAEGRTPAVGIRVATRQAVLAGLDRYLELLNDEDGRLRASLLFLLAHFPEDRRRILDAARSIPLDADRLTRLDRCLQQPAFPDAAASRRLGRSWPSPATCDSVAGAHGLTHTESLPPDELDRLWKLETVTLLAYAGALAHHGIEGGIR